MSIVAPFLNLADEDARLSALRGMDILDTPPEDAFDELTRLAAAALGTRSAAITLIDHERSWFKARQNVSFSQAPCEMAFCNHVVTQRETLVIPDASADRRFADHPMVNCPGGIRFYAGAPVFASTGHCIGALCVTDLSPRGGLDLQQVTTLEHAATLAGRLIESRRARRMAKIAAKVVEATTDAIVAADRQGGIVYLNGAAERMFGYSAAEAFGLPLRSIVDCRSLEDPCPRDPRVSPPGLVKRESGFEESEAKRRDGSLFSVEVSLAQWGAEDTEGGPAAIVRDISDRRKLEREKQYAQDFLDTVITNLPVMLFAKDPETREYVLVNKAGEKLIGRPAADIIGRTDREIFPESAAAIEARDAEAVARKTKLIFEGEITREEGRTEFIRTTRVLVGGLDGQKQFILGVAEDLTPTRVAEAEALRLARFDSLTGLLNRASLTEVLHDKVVGGKPFAMVSIDLDRFKVVNDQFGHPVGDEVLKEVGCRLGSICGAVELAARIGGDEFVAIVEGDNLRQRAAQFGSRVIEQAERPFKVQRLIAHIGASVGIVLYPYDGQTTEQLRERSDLALYRAKKDGKGLIRFFDPGMDDTVRHRRKLEVALRQAVEDRGITLQYQPVLSVATGEVSSFEALARWFHPEFGPIPPNTFIPVAEESGIIHFLGKELLLQACTDARTWPSDVCLAVNLSPRQFQSGKLVDEVREVLAVTGFPPHRLQLEVTEGLVIQDVERTFAQLEQLRSFGIQVLIDDFGVGYSSLSYFQRFRFDKVKIDGSFVNEIETSPTARAIVAAVAGLGQQLSMGVVAEGVETEMQIRHLIAVGCTHLQGYFFSRPLDAHQVPTFVQDGGQVSLGPRKAA